MTNRVIHIIAANPDAPASHVLNTESMACSLRAAIGKGWFGKQAEPEAAALYRALNKYLKAVGEE